MPRTMDHGERDRQVVEAAWRVIARDGMPALTVRNVAAEAGLAPSSLRYAFPTQASVRERAITVAVDRFRERIDRVAVGAGRARALLLELLPLDDVRWIEVQVTLALAFAASTEADLRPIRAALDDDVRNVCRQACEELKVTDDARIDELHAIIDGLALHVVLGVDPNGYRALRVLDTYLEQLV